MGRMKFDVDSEEIGVVGRGITGTECDALVALMKSGEMRRLKRLYLVRLFSELFQFR